MLPIMTEAFSGFQQQSQFALVKRTQDTFDTVESAQVIGYFLGVLEPLDARKLNVKMEGWRTWKCFTLWTKQEILAGDYVRDPRGLQYRVMAKNDWAQAAYIEYQLVQSDSLPSEAP